MVSTKDKEGKCAHCTRLKKDCAFQPVDQTAARTRKKRELLRKGSQAAQGQAGASTSPEARRDSVQAPYAAASDGQPSFRTVRQYSTGLDGSSAVLDAFQSPACECCETPWATQPETLTLASVPDEHRFVVPQEQLTPPTFSQSMEAHSVQQPSSYEFTATSDRNWELNEAYDTHQHNMSLHHDALGLAGLTAPEHFQPTTIKDALRRGSLIPNAMTSTVTTDPHEFLSPSLPAYLPTDNSLHRSHTISFPIEPMHSGPSASQYMSPKSDFLSASYSEPLPSLGLPTSSMAAASFLSPAISEPQPMTSNSFLPSPSFYTTSVGKDSLSAKPLYQSSLHDGQTLAVPTSSTNTSNNSNTSASPFPWPSPFSPTSEGGAMGPGALQRQTSFSMQPVTPGSELTMDKVVAQHLRERKWYE